MGIEQSVIQHCAPTLAGMKAAGLFNFFYEGKELLVIRISVLS